MALFNGFAVNPPSSPTSRLSSDYRRGLYLANAMTTRYVYGSGLLQIPLAKKDGECKFVRTSQPMMLMVVQFHVARLGLMPKYPSYEVSDPNLVFLGGEVDVSAPAIDLDGSTYTYDVSGYYVYGMKKPVFVKDGLKMSALTIDTTAPGTNILPAVAAVKRF